MELWKKLYRICRESSKPIKVIFDRGVYVGKNTFQAASVEFVANGEQIMRAAGCKKLSEKPEGIFRHIQPSSSF